jgi:hypothetical protein
MDKFVPAELKTITRQKLIERESGAAYMIEAMQYHFDYLNEVSPPPMGVVAQALVKMKAKEGVVPLVQHLMDHETSLDDLREIAAAVLVLGDESVVPTVSEYLVRYHADSAFKANLDTLYLLAEAVLAFGGVQGRELLEKLQADPNTVPALAQHIKDAFGAAAQKELDAKLAAENQGKPAVEASPDAIVEEGKVYQTLTQKQVMAVLDPHRAELLPCIQEYLAAAANPVYQIRMKFILNNKGKIENFMTLPSDPKLSSCLMGELLKIKWPKIKELKQALQYVLSVEKPKPQQPDWPPLPVAPQPQPQPQPVPQPQPKPDEWLPVPKPQPLPQPAQPQPQPLPQPGEKKPKPDEKKPDEKKPDEKKPDEKKPDEKQPTPGPQPGFQEYPDVLPEDMPEK